MINFNITKLQIFYILCERIWKKVQLIAEDNRNRITIYIDMRTTMI